MERKILIIDDDPLFHQSVTRILQRKKYECWKHFSVKSALRKMMWEYPDLVLLDLNMPGFDGIDFLKIRKRSALLSQVPVIVSSGFQDEHLIRKVLKWNISAFLVKTCVASDLLTMVRDYTQK